MRRKSIPVKELSGFAVFDLVIAKRGRSRWEWRVCSDGSQVIMHGWQNSRTEARYRGERALFLLLLAGGTQHGRRYAVGIVSEAGLRRG